MSFLFYSFISSLIFNIYYKKITSYTTAFKQFITIQKKLWQGLITFMLPFLLSIILAKIAPHFPKDKTFLILLFYSTSFFYMIFFIIFDLVSHFYIFHIDKNHVILSNLIMMCVIFYFFYPILISFSLLLTDDLQSRNNLCDVTKNK